jgi:uncharacterized membrane protein
MFQIPEPLHPALVHFPIVLLLIGAVGALVSVFTDKWNARKWTALLLIAGAFGAFVATWSGNQAKETIGELAQTAENLLDRHEELAETTRNVAIATGVIGLVSAFVKSKGAFRRVATLATAVMSLICVYYIVETAHLGGKMVYQHGVGTVSATATLKPSNPSSFQQNGRESDRD